MLIVSGTIPDKESSEFEEERSLELKALTKEAYKSKLIPPLPKWLKIFYFIIGYTFLFIGLTLLVLILIGTFG